MSATHTIDGKEIVAYGDMFEYVEDADFTEYVDTTIAYEGEFIVRSIIPVNDPSFCTSSNDMVELNDGELYQKVWFGEEFDECDRYVKESNLGDEISLIYVWNVEKLMYVAFNGIAYSCDEDAQAKIKEIESRGGVVWDVVEDGYYTNMQKGGISVAILLRVGHGLPDFMDAIGSAELAITKNNSPTITERLNFSAHPDRRGEITGEFFNSDGITEDCGEAWGVDDVALHDPANMDDGDDRNDDIMKKFIERYVARLDYADELMVAQVENFCIEE